MEFLFHFFHNLEIGISSGKINIPPPSQGMKNSLLLFSIFTASQRHLLTYPQLQGKDWTGLIGEFQTRSLAQT